MPIHRERRALAKVHLAELVLAALAVKGWSQIEIPREQIKDELWHSLIVETIEDPDRDCLIIRFKIKGYQFSSSEIPIGEYTIEDPSLLPSPPLQLPSGVAPLRSND